MKVIIFGNRDLAQLARYYLTYDTCHTVVGFAVNKEFRDSNDFDGLPLYEFETIEKQLPPKQGYRFFAPVTGKGMNTLREKIYTQIKDKGYECISYISSKATNFSSSIGENCFILEDNTLQPYTQIGNNVILWSGNHIGHHSKIEDNAFFTSHVVLSGHCNVGKYSWFGVNSTVRDGCNIAEGTCLAMGGCLTKDKTDPWSLYVGIPAKKREGNPKDII